MLSGGYFHQDAEVLGSLLLSPMCAAIWGWIYGARLVWPFSPRCCYSNTPHTTQQPWDVTVVQSLSHVQLLATPCTVAHQAALSMGFPRQEYWSGLPFPSPGALPNPGIEPASLALAGGCCTTEPPGKPQHPWARSWLKVISQSPKCNCNSWDCYEMVHDHCVFDRGLRFHLWILFH